MKSIKVAEGVALSEVCLGAGGLGAPENDAHCFAIMDAFVEAGGNTFDTARVYAGGECDRALGRWISSRGCRGRVVVVTKGSHPEIGTMFVSRLSKAEIEGDLEASLAAIGTDHSDLHLLHRDDVKKPIEEIVDALDGLVKSGKTLAVGVSNWTSARVVQANLYAAAAGKSPISCVQAHYGLGVTTAHATGDLTHVPLDGSEVVWYKESQLPVMAFSAQARGWFVKRANGVQPQGSPSRYYDYFPENYRRLERLKKLSAELGRSLAAVTTAYARDSGLNAAPLCAFSSVAQLRDSMDALNFRLSPEQVRFLEQGV